MFSRAIVEVTEAANILIRSLLTEAHMPGGSTLGTFKHSPLHACRIDGSATTCYAPCTRSRAPKIRAWIPGTWRSMTPASSYRRSFEL